MTDPPAPVSVPHDAGHLEAFDGLRGLAIVLVVWFHLWQLGWLASTITLFGHELHFNFLAETGWVGVELFFLVSGFCLFYPHARHRIEGRAIAPWRTYWYRRAIKILPSYWLGIAVIALFFPRELGASSQVALQLASHLLFVHNLSPVTYGGINGVFWSLAVEVQFYAAFPWLAAAFRRWPLPSFALMVGVAYVFRTYAIAIHPDQAGFWLGQLPAYLDCFAAGMGAAYELVWFRSRAQLPEGLRWPMTALAIASALAVMGLLLDLYAGRSVAGWPSAWQATHRLYLAIAFAVFGVASQLASRPWRAIVANPLLVFFSGISYNLYLWHQFIGRQLMAGRLPAPRTPDPHQDPVWQVGFTALAWGLAIAVSYGLTRWWERPFLARGWSAFWPHARLRRTASAAVGPGPADPGTSQP